MSRSFQQLNPELLVRRLQEAGSKTTCRFLLACRTLQYLPHVWVLGRLRLFPNTSETLATMPCQYGVCLQSHRRDSSVHFRSQSAYKQKQQDLSRSANDHYNVLECFAGSLCLEDNPASPGAKPGDDGFNARLTLNPKASTPNPKTACYDFGASSQLWSHFTNRSELSCRTQQIPKLQVCFWSSKRALQTPLWTI